MIPGKLAGVRKPTLEEIAELQASGIGAIVSVMDDSSNLDLYEQADIPFCWLPTKGGIAPSQEQIQALQAFVEQQSQCRGRTGIGHDRHSRHQLHPKQPDRVTR